MMFSAIALHRRVAMFGVRHQMLHVLAILLLMQVIVLAVRVAAGGEYPGRWYFVPSVIAALLWPVTRFLFRILLRSRRDPDEM
jgi:rod shape-determining protein MreD